MYAKKAQSAFVSRTDSPSRQRRAIGQSAPRRGQEAKPALSIPGGF